MKEDRLKELWGNAHQQSWGEEYNSASIQRFLGRRSGTIAGKIRTLVQFDILLKILVALGLAFNAYLYYASQYSVAVLCMIELLVIISLIRYEFYFLQDFHAVSDPDQSTRDKLTGMLGFLRTRFFPGIISISSTYLFGFTAGVLLYFKITYGYIRPLDNMDIFVFSTICLIGIVMNYFTTQSQVNYQRKHIELCLSDLNENSFDLVTQHIEERRKKDILLIILIMLAFLLGLILFVLILKKAGF